MAKRRSPGEGSIFQDKNGRWVAMIELPRRPDGRRNRKMRRARTRAEAQRKLRELRALLDELGENGLDSRTVGTMLDDFAVVRAATSPSRKVQERDDLADDLIRRFFGESTLVRDVNVGHCDEFLSQVVGGTIMRSGRPVSRDYARRFRSFLSRAFVNEIRRGYLTSDPAQHAIIPASPVTSKLMRALSKSEWRRLYETSTGVVQIAVDLGGRHGLRPQEVRSVRWSDVDWEAATLSVINQFDADDEFVDTKTEASTRTIRIHSDTLALLETWLDIQADFQHTADDRWTDRGLVVTTRWGTAINQNNYRRSFRQLCLSVGIDPITPYELRHTAITHQIDSGFTATQVADWAGTSERMIQKHYRHRLREVAELGPANY